MGEIVLAGGGSALVLLHQVLLALKAQFGDAFGQVDVPDSLAQFRKTYPTVLPLFEAARIASFERTQIAQHASRLLSEKVVWQDNEAQVALGDLLAQPKAPPSLSTHEFSGPSGWAPNFVYHGQRWEAGQFADLSQRLVVNNLISPSAGNSLQAVAAQLNGSGKLDLSNRKIAVLGAGAEMAPTRLWLECGAEVLWLDTQPPPEDWWTLPNMSGRLVWPEGNVDLLSDPQAILAAILEFSEGQPVDLGLYAYAPGAARELRLTAAMNAIVDALPAQILGSVTMLVSPTTPTQLSPAELEASATRLDQRPRWEAVCDALGMLGRGGGMARSGRSASTKTVVAIQGASYQAAQYLGKLMVAESWAKNGQLGISNPEPLRVSANTAAITKTRSLEHPIFAAAFGGAAAFGVETLVPRQSRRINGLLALQDWVQAELPEPGTVKVHGGIHTLPYPLDRALRVAAAIGFARSPRLLKGLFRR